MISPTPTSCLWSLQIEPPIAASIPSPCAKGNIIAFKLREVFKIDTSAPHFTNDKTENKWKKQLPKYQNTNSKEGLDDKNYFR